MNFFAPILVEVSLYMTSRGKVKLMKDTLEGMQLKNGSSPKENLLTPLSFFAKNLTSKVNKESYDKTTSLDKIRNEGKGLLTHFLPLVSFGFLMFSGGIERDHWYEMD